MRPRAGSVGALPAATQDAINEAVKRAVPVVVDNIVPALRELIRRRSPRDSSEAQANAASLSQLRAVAVQYVQGALSAEDFAGQAVALLIMSAEPSVPNEPRPDA